MSTDTSNTHANPVIQMNEVIRLTCSCFAVLIVSSVHYHESLSFSKSLLPIMSRDMSRFNIKLQFVYADLYRVYIGEERGGPQ